MKKVLLAFMFLCVAGCTMQEPISSKDAAPIDKSRVYLYQEANDATLVVTRDKGYRGSFCSVTFYIDGNLAARFDSGVTSTFYVAGGSHVLGVSSDGVCTGASLQEYEIMMKKGETIKRRISVTGAGDIVISPTSLE